MKEVGLDSNEIKTETDKERVSERDEEQAERRRHTSRAPVVRVNGQGRVLERVGRSGGHLWEATAKLRAR